MKFTVRSFTFCIAKGVPDIAAPELLWPNFCHAKNPPMPRMMTRIRITLNHKRRRREIGGTSELACVLGATGVAGAAGAAVTPEEFSGVPKGRLCHKKYIAG